MHPEQQLLGRRLQDSEHFELPLLVAHLAMERQAGLERALRQRGRRERRTEIALELRRIVRIECFEVGRQALAGRRVGQVGRRRRRRAWTGEGQGGRATPRTTDFERASSVSRRRPSPAPNARSIALGSRAQRGDQPRRQILRRRRVEIRQHDHRRAIGVQAAGRRSSPATVLRRPPRATALRPPRRSRRPPNSSTPDRRCDGGAAPRPSERGRSPSCSCHPPDCRVRAAGRCWAAASTSAKRRPWPPFRRSR